MAAGKHGSTEVTIALDDSGGTPVTITGFVLTIGAMKITANMQKSDAFGDTFEEMLATGVAKVDKIALHGFFDDSSGGPHGLFKTLPTGPQSTTRTLTVGVGNSNSF